MKKVFLKWVMVVSSMLFLQTTVNASTKAEALAAVKGSVNIVLSDLKANKSKYESDLSALNSMIDKKMVPYFDVNRMAKFVLGKNWKSSSTQQRTDFINSFKKLIMRAYSSVLLDYTDADVKFEEPSTIKKNRTKIKAHITNNSGKKLSLELKMHYKNKQWKGYDVSMDGLSVITSYRSSIGQEISEKGIDKVIAEIKSLNRKGKN